MWHANIRRNRILELGTAVGSLASVLGFMVAILFANADLPIWLIVVIVIVVIVATVTIVPGVAMIFWPDHSIRRYDLHDTQKINRYLFQWIDKGGRVAIWTRDMSWVDQSEMMPMLCKKAEDGELIICLPRRIEKSDQLESHGAEVIAYGTLDTPSMTFTIANYGRRGSRVAVGSRSGNKHIIQEFSAEEHPAFHLASDLVRLVRENDNTSE